jgi:hypothetical protein
MDIKKTSQIVFSRMLNKALICFIIMLVGFTSSLLADIFEIDIGISVIISTISMLTIYTVYKVVKLLISKRKSEEKQTLWEKMGISEEMRDYLIGITMRLSLVALGIVLSILLSNFFDVVRSLIISAVTVVIIIPICYKYKLHIRFYKLITSKIKNKKNRELMPKSFPQNSSTDTVCKNCAALLDKNIFCCPNCGTTIKRNNGAIFAMGVLIFFVAIFIIQRYY